MAFGKLDARIGKDMLLRRMGGRVPCNAWSILSGRSEHRIAHYTGDMGRPHDIRCHISACKG